MLRDRGVIKSLAPGTGSWEVKPHRAALKYGSSFQAIAVDSLLHSDPELEAQGDTPPLSEGNRSLASEVSCLPVYES